MDLTRCVKATAAREAFALASGGFPNQALLNAMPGVTNTRASSPADFTVRSSFFVSVFTGWVVFMS
jgi:hypothetical protein